MSPSREHGKYSTYTNYACRCEPCRDAGRRQRRKYLSDPVKHEEQKARLRRNHRRRNAAIQKIKMESGCVDCGYREDPSRLHFDHLPGYVKLFNIAHGIQRRWDVVLAEIAKCEVVCNPCHGVRSALRAGKGVMVDG